MCKDLHESTYRHLHVGHVKMQQYGFPRTTFGPHISDVLSFRQSVRSKTCIKVKLHYCTLCMHTNSFSDYALDGESLPIKLPLNYAIHGVGMDGKAESKDLYKCNYRHLCQMIKEKGHQGNLNTTHAL